jgi:hypothetical protein
MMGPIMYQPSFTHTAPTQPCCEFIEKQYNTCIVEKRSVEECTNILKTLYVCQKKTKNITLKEEK